jgi:hypothetical protein
MQAVDGPDSSQLKWHQEGVKTNSDGYCVNCGLNSGGRSIGRIGYRTPAQHRRELLVEAA